MPIFPALEEDASGTTQVEKERVFYACLKNSAVLKSASHSEHQEQWQIRLPKTPDNDVEGRIRVRKTAYSDGRIEFVQTIKIPNAGSVPGHSNMAETSVPVTADVFEQFKRLAADGMVKTRYFFPVGQRLLEVDVFKIDDGIANWVKVDYEFGPGEPSTPEQFPAGFEQIIAGDTTDEADKAFISQLYRDVFNKKA